ncbi:type I-D CRISPR-associated endonuclease Cas1d [Dictyobacter aurantiacus]|uniref:CRISPR-associated endonuclease Cas1 n=1 Tax=Dictyobacter aurantiacus TaxID=1936993 RepID=A0A401ZQY4_9CHLR|nr:type I-D CRISPR-associated endonuclease Cas1d [Dictyobacter aurantiacus]GCE09283.1 CRISPR-associated endonuclease Cas1 [Dictyobacter aurantiacus]
MATLYLSEQQSFVKKRDEYLLIRYQDKRTVEVPIHKVTQVVISGDVTVTTPALHLLLERGIEVCYLSMYGQFRGRLSPPVAKNAFLRRSQHRAHIDEQQALHIARACVKGKLENMRVMLMRANRSLQNSEIEDAAAAIRIMGQQATTATTIGSLLGIEGNGSRSYFGVFDKLLRGSLPFPGRRRRPPTDPVNAMLSLGYTLLHHQVSSAIQVVGLDPYVGFLHQPRHGRPALALDLMEEFRPIIVDSVVLNIVNHHILSERDFEEELGVVLLKSSARKIFYAKFEERLLEELHHPHFGYRTNYRRCIELQTRLLAKWLTNEIPNYPPLCIR